MKTQGAVVRTDRSRKRTHAYPPALPFQAHSELALLFLLGDYSCGFGTRPRSGRERAKSMDMVAFSLGQRVPCFTVSLPLWEPCERVKFPSLSAAHFISQGAKLGTEPPLTQLMNDSILPSTPLSSCHAVLYRCSLQSRLLCNAC